jgi:hypothetical protein
LLPALHDEGEIGSFVMTLEAALEETELLCTRTIISDNGTGTIIPPHAPLHNRSKRAI